MKKLNIYLNPDQYEKLQILTGETDEEKLEELLNAAVTDGIESAWLKHEVRFEDNAVTFTRGGHNFRLYSDGEQAVITKDDETVTVQLIGGRLHTVLADGERVPCGEDLHAAFLTTLSEAGIELKDFTEEELNESII